MNSLMETEILEQSTVIEGLIAKYIQNYCVMVNFPSKLKRVRFIASGSSYHAASVGKKFFRDIAGIECDCDYSGEFLSAKSRNIDKDSLYFLISQSGETADTVEVLDILKKAGAKTFAVVNNDKSYLYDNADYSMDASAGKEQSIAATKSFTACVFCTWLCAVKAAQNMSKDVSKYLTNISYIPRDMDETLFSSKKIDKAAAFLSKYKSFAIVGYDYYFELAKEGALKIKETSYIDSNAYALGEFVHGHVALLNNQSALVEIFSGDLSAYERKNLTKIETDYAPKVIAVTDSKDIVKTEFDLLFPKVECTITRVLCAALVLQLLALKIAYKLKRDVDCPTGLSKVVR